MVWERTPKLLFVDSGCIDKALYDAIKNLNIGGTASVCTQQKPTIPAGEHNVKIVPDLTPVELKAQNTKKKSV